PSSRYRGTVHSGAGSCRSSSGVLWISRRGGCTLVGSHRGRRTRFPEQLLLGESEFEIRLEFEIGITLRDCRRVRRRGCRRLRRARGLVRLLPRIGFGTGGPRFTLPAVGSRCRVERLAKML